MSDRGGRLCNIGDEMPEKHLKPYQYVWMAHWRRTSCGPANEARNHFGLHYESKEDNQNAKHHHPLLSGPEVEADGAKLVKGFGEVTKAKMINFMNESLSTSSGKLRDKTYKGFPFQTLKSSQYRENVLALKDGESSSHNEESLRSQIDPNSGYDVSLDKAEHCLPEMLVSAPSETETQSAESLLQLEGMTVKGVQQFKSKKLLERHTLAASTPLKDEFLGSTSKIVPYEFNNDRAQMESFFCGPGDIDQPSAAVLFHDKRMTSNAALLIHDPSTSKGQLRDFVSKQFPKMPNHSDIERFPSHISPPEANKLEKSCNRSYALPVLPSSVHDAETMRICATADSVKEFSRGPPKFSQTTHHFFISKQTDVNLLDRAQMFKESAISTKLKGKTVSELCSLSPNLGFNVKQGLKLQPEDSSVEGKGQENVENVNSSVVNLKNESSTETDTMDVDAFWENVFSGVASSPSNKDVKKGEKSPTSQAAVASGREEIRGRFMNKELHDINQELPVLPEATSSADDLETSSSRTQSLDVEHFLSNVEHPANSKYGDCADDQLELDPCSRWVKRLRPSTSDSFAYGTKSSKLGEASSHEKVKKFFSKVLNGSKTSSEPKTSKSLGKEQMAVDQTAELLRNAESCSIGSVRKNEHITLSHDWIRRWCHKPAAALKRKIEAVAVCEPQSSKAALDKFQKKQFPSIAAMALMGKAMTGFRPCEFTRRGSLVIWNTKGS